MKTKTVRRNFPESQAAKVHLNGVQLSDYSNGVEILLHTRANEVDPWCTEVISGEHCSEIGLWLEGKGLVDFDGAFRLPREVAIMLMESGYVVSEEFFESVD